MMMAICKSDLKNDSSTFYFNETFNYLNVYHPNRVWKNNEDGHIIGLQLNISRQVVQFTSMRQIPEKQEDFKSFLDFLKTYY